MTTTGDAVYKDVNIRCPHDVEHVRFGTQGLQHLEDTIGFNQSSIVVFDMSMLGKIRIGHKAPDLHCVAVTKGIIQGSFVIAPRLLYLKSLTNDHDRSNAQRLHPTIHQARVTSSRRTMAPHHVHTGCLQLRVSYRVSRIPRLSR